LYFSEVFSRGGIVIRIGKSSNLVEIWSRIEESRGGREEDCFEKFLGAIGVIHWRV
jgi:hypothetical protein